MYLWLKVNLFFTCFFPGAFSIEEEDVDHSSQVQLVLNAKEYFVILEDTMA